MTGFFALQDVAALVTQSIGGALASGTRPILGGHIALVGIVLQFGMVTHQSYVPFPM